MSYLAPCDVCSKEFNDGDTAFGIGTGHMSNEIEGFMADLDEEWTLIMCQKCMDKVNENIWDFISKKE